LGLLLLFGVCAALARIFIGGGGTFCLPYDK
jgi:hypothetical protein